MMLNTEAETLALGARIAGILRPGDCIALAGDLGAGKTTLARGILTALGLQGEAPSPTFAIVQPYDPPETRIPVWHIDLYRIEEPDELAELGLGDMRREVAMLIEWPERMAEALWDDTLQLDLHVEPQSGGQPAARRLTVRVPDAWEGRWPPD